MGIYKSQAYSTTQNQSHQNYLNDDTNRKNWMLLNFAGNSVDIWKSRLSWRITAAAFLTIMTVQAVILAMSLENIRQQELRQTVQPARAAISSMIPADRSSEMLAPPFSNKAEQRLLKNTIITGIETYTNNFDLIRFSGEPVQTAIENIGDIGKSKLNMADARYETVMGPSDLGGAPYYMVVRLDASQAIAEVERYVWNKITVMFLLSAFVTTVLMIALGRWLLEPILFLRSNLKEATRNPENPDIPANQYRKDDEIGSAINSAQQLIAQNAENIRQIKDAAESQIHMLAYYDTLTGLPNRTLFLDQLGEQAEAAGNGQRNIGHFAVIAMDIDHFKDINDTMGHKTGDTILRAVGERLKSAMPDNAIVARSGEDEFAITMPLDSDNETARDIGERIRQVIREKPFKVYNENFQIRVSVGVATFPDDGQEPDQVLKNADIALNRAKEDGRNILREYLEDFDRAVQQRFQMLRALRDALEQEELSVHFQPQFNLQSGELIGAESLIRWWKPDSSKEGGHYVSPGEFIPVAEQSGLIVPIGEWVLRKACALARDWHDQGYTMRLAVNVSGKQFHQSDFGSFMRRVLEETGAPPQSIELEVTESVFMEDIDNTVELLKDLHAMGIELAIDDFGTGYSSLSYLRQFPIDRLKIDKSFILNSHVSEDDSSIARTIIRLGHSMGLQVIAEGVENKEHEHFLKTEGCDEVQGFRYARAMPAEDFYAFIKNYGGDLSEFD